MTLSRRWAIVLGLLFALSLALNFFIGGLIAGRATGLNPASIAQLMGPGAGLKFTLAKMAKALPADQRPILRETLRSYRGEIEAAVDGLQEARHEIGAALRAEPFDPAALNAAADGLKQANIVLQTRLIGALEEAVLKLGPEGRRALADWRK